MNMNILSWSVKRLEKSKRQRSVKDILSEHKIDIVNLQEMKKEEFRYRTINNLSSDITKRIILPFIGRSGGILVGINENKFEVSDSWILTYSISIIKNKDSGFTWLFTIVYGPVSLGLRRDF
jgi:hypothetical protein